VLGELREEVVPAADQLALVLVVDQVELVRLPVLADLLQELLERQLSLSEEPSAPARPLSLSLFGKVPERW
jgi:hypothetical protein